MFFFVTGCCFDVIQLFQRGYARNGNKSLHVEVPQSCEMAVGDEQCVAQYVYFDIYLDIHKNIYTHMIYIYAYIHIYIYTYIHIYIYTYIHIYIYTYIHIYIYNTYIHIYVYTYIRMYVCFTADGTKSAFGKNRGAVEVPYKYRRGPYRCCRGPLYSCF